VDVPGAGFNHDMALTGKYAVLFDGSARFTPQQMVANKPVFSWDGNFATRVALVPRDATDNVHVRWFESPSVSLSTLKP
jgi:carotenoid cleavage dioxygenase-like enzyme